MATSDFSIKPSQLRKYEFFKEEFDRLATNGVIGDPNGEPAYGYARVSSDEQGDEGRTGLPRQIEHIHIKACELHRYISWDMLFCDDFTGFELERPALDQLRAEYCTSRKRANMIIMEYLDRLSRNADWHQGYLLDEMKKRAIEPIFWKAFSSRIERIVMGTVAQDAMELALERMADGFRKKAESGRVTARTPAYGYKLVDDHGNEGTRARKMTYYAIREDQAVVVRRIFTRVAEGATINGVARELALAGVKPTRNSKNWLDSNIRTIIRNPVYKGDFIANRSVEVAVEKPTKDGQSIRITKRRVDRPEAEWIRVPVPAIVDEATWQSANDMLAKNRVMAARNAHKNRRYLLTGLLKCADCGSTLTGQTYKPGQSGRLAEGQNYRCRFAYAGHVPRYALEKRGRCSQGSIMGSIIEPAVWKVICEAIMQPDVLLAALEANTLDSKNTLLGQQIEYLSAEIEARKAEDDKLYRAYVAGVFDENEYGERRRLLKTDVARLITERDRLIPQRVSVEQVEAQKQMIIQFSEKLNRMNGYIDPPFELKQQILKLLVDQIVVNTRERWFRLEGVIRGNFAIENIPVRRNADRARRPDHRESGW